jgi:hypothetical protein
MTRYRWWSVWRNDGFKDRIEVDLRPNRCRVTQVVVGMEAIPMFVVDDDPPLHSRECAWLPGGWRAAGGISALKRCPGLRRCRSAARAECNGGAGRPELRGLPRTQDSDPGLPSVSVLHFYAGK